MSQPFGAPSEAIRPDKGSLRIKFSIGMLIPLAALLLLGFNAFVYFRDRSNYEQGHAAYLQADCATARTDFQNILKNGEISPVDSYKTLVYQEQAECHDFQSAVSSQDGGDAADALVYYSRFVTRYPNSPLASVARSRAADVFNGADVTALATESFCDDLQTIQTNQMIVAPETNMPLLYYNCGQAFDAASRPTDAIRMYQAFMDNYGDHPLKDKVRTAMTHSVVAEAEAEGAVPLPEPVYSGTTGNASTLVVIQNNSPEQMQIIFSGPDSRIETLAACTTCGKFSQSSSGPDTCTGPIGRYTLNPGEYDVVVEASSDTGVTPFRGTWGLRSGYAYSNCFYIATNNPLAASGNNPLLFPSQSPLMGSFYATMTALANYGSQSLATSTPPAPQTR